MCEQGRTLWQAPVPSLYTTWGGTPVSFGEPLTSYWQRNKDFLWLVVSRALHIESTIFMASNSLISIYLPCCASSWAVAEVTFWLFLGSSATFGTADTCFSDRRHSLGTYSHWVLERWRWYNLVPPTGSYTLVKVSTGTTCRFRNCTQ